MREIKFRAYSQIRKRWIYGYYFKTPLTEEDSGVAQGHGWFFLSDGKTRHCISTENGVAFVIDVKTLGQFTGLHDKNGKEIYEGDILHWESPDEEGAENYEVIWIEKEACFGTKIIINKPIFAHFNTGYIEDHEPHQDEEVIGNIYENPELLEETK